MTPSPHECPFFVIGSGPARTRDDGERAEWWEDHSLQAAEALGSVEVVYAASAGEAEVNARVEAIQTAARIRRDLTSTGRKAGARSRRSGVGSHHHMTHYYR